MIGLLPLLIRLFDGVFCCDGGRRERLLGQSSLLYLSCCCTIPFFGSTNHLLIALALFPLMWLFYLLMSANLSVVYWLFSYWLSN